MRTHRFNINSITDVHKVCPRATILTIYFNKIHLNVTFPVPDSSRTYFPSNLHFLPSKLVHSGYMPNIPYYGFYFLVLGVAYINK